MAQHLAKKYQLDLDQFEKDEQMLSNQEPVADPRAGLLREEAKNENWLKDSIR